MKYQEFYEARQKIVSIMREDLLGPVEPDEILDDIPVGYYLLGKLYPGHIVEVSEDGRVITEEDEALEEEAELLGNQVYQSAMGISFALSPESKSFLIKCRAAKYNLIDETAKVHQWKRQSFEKEITIDIEELKKVRKVCIEIDDILFLYVIISYSTYDTNYHIIVSLANNSVVPNKRYETLSKQTYFQPEIRICQLSEGNFQTISHDLIDIDDEETRELNMLYSHYGNYANGHGCSADWNFDASGLVKEIYTEIMPSFNVHQMMPSNCFDSEILSMKNLAKSSYSTISRHLYESIQLYRNWIKEQEKNALECKSIQFEVAEKNIKNCRRVCDRIENSINLMSAPIVYKAFQLANETMLLQRTKDKTLNKDALWYPYQLAFLIMEIDSIIHPDSEERQLVDLLWFPTGGGKTEAYLGIAAFTMFYLKLQEDKKQTETEHVYVVMRYTLRLLSLQQFERASAMICAAELLRKREKIGKIPFSIGLWVGESMTPNKLQDAKEYIMTGKNGHNSSPLQIKKCPWCGNSIGIKNYSVDKANVRMRISCGNKCCDFCNELPIHLIDEDIYDSKPSFLVGTVDKFAQIAYKSEVFDLLGVDDGISPELIIQDELHLISGPLGTIAGIYEAAISEICRNDGAKPKVIASTATIRNAMQQVKALYGKDYMQFPPQGIDVDDSFFAEKSTESQKPTRMYLGMMPSGTSNATAFNRIMGSILFASRYLVDCGFSDDVIDAFWTETGYFNTLKELGSALIRIIDNVQDRFRYLRDTKFADKYHITSDKNRYAKFYELTSRNNSAELGEILQKELLIPYSSKKKTDPYDFLMASNMISVGVDVARLGTMLVMGQPMKTAEYIQATSRVGRSNPGLVITFYYGNRNRDRSHYEQFVSYHSSFYKYVEPTSLTPFSDRSRDRALHALYIILCRAHIKQLRNNNQAKNYRRNIPELEKIRQYIYDYVKMVDPDELDNIKEELSEIEYLWEEQSENASELVYSDSFGKKHSLYAEEYKENNRFRMMNSMRNIEPAIQVSVEE